MLYLHIGSQKTGSSSIQHFLRPNRAALLAQGVNFVNAARPWIDHNPLARELRQDNQDSPHLDAILAEIAESAVPDHIVSAEMLFHPRVGAKLGRHLPAHIIENTRVIVYLRRPDDLMEALYKQRVKTGAIEPRPMQYLRKAGFECDYLASLSGFESVFGRERMIVRPYRRDLLAGGDIVQDFLETIGHGGLNGLPRGKPEDNPTFSAPLSELMGAYVKRSKGDSVKLNEILAAENMPGIKRSGDVFNVEQRRALLESLEGDLDAICATYGEALRPVLQMPDFAALGDKGYPGWREWSELHRNAGHAVVNALTALLAPK